MEKRSSIRKVQFRCDQVRFCASIKRTPCESRELETAALRPLVFAPCGGRCSKIYGLRASRLYQQKKHEAFGLVLLTKHQRCQAAAASNIGSTGARST